MRYLVCLMLSLPVPTMAWDFTSDPVCTIWHDIGSAEMRVTYDPRQAEPYSIFVTFADATWAPSTPYMIRFDGVRSFSIATNRHRLSEDARAVIASDTGFGNVLGGLSLADRATAILGEMSVQFPLVGAAAAVERLEACARPGMS